MLLRRPDVLERNAAFLGVRTGEGPHRASIPRRLLMGACHCDVCVAPWCQRRCVCSRRILPLLCPLCVALAEVASGRDSEVGCRPDLSDLEPHSSGQAVSFQRRCFIFQSRRPGWGFPGGCLVKNPPASAGDMGSIPDPGSSHVLWSNEAAVPSNLWSRQKPLPTEAHAPQSEWPPLAAMRERPTQQPRPSTATKKQSIKSF